MVCGDDLVLFVMASLILVTSKLKTVYEYLQCCWVDQQMLLRIYDMVNPQQILKISLG